jgi:hypothetical protein
MWCPQPVCGCSLFFHQGTVLVIPSVLWLSPTLLSLQNERLCWVKIFWMILRWWTLTFWRLAFVYVNEDRKTPLEIRFIYLGNKEIYWIFKTCYIISVLFSTKFHLLHNFTFFSSNNTFFINHVLKFKYLPQ